MPRDLFIIWKPENETGLSILDEQNRGLVSIINTFFFHRDEVSQDIHRVLVPTMEMFKSYARLHFLTIEKLMEETNYPDIKKYRKIHEETLSNILISESRYRKLKDGEGMLQYLKKHLYEELENKKDYVEYLTIHLQT